MISDRADMAGCFLCQELLWNPTRKCATEKDHITPLFYGSFHLFNAIWEPAKKEHCRKAMFIFWKYVPYLTQVGWVLGTPNVTHGKSVGSYSKLYSKSIIFPCSWNVKNHANSLHLCSFACLQTYGMLQCNNNEYQSSFPLLLQINFNIVQWFIKIMQPKRVV